MASANEADIEVTHEAGDEYRVQVREKDGASSHRVTVTEAHLSEYGAGADAGTLLEKSFRFLLEREPRGSIMSRFELPVIERYFPEYPREIARRLGG